MRTMITKNMMTVCVFCIMTVVVTGILSEAQAQKIHTINVEVEGDDEDVRAQEDNTMQATGRSVRRDPWSADPFQYMMDMHRDMQQMQQHMRSMFDDPFFQRDALTGGSDIGYRYEDTGETIKLICSVPGVVDGTIDVQVTPDHVQIQGMQESIDQNGSNTSYGSTRYYASTRSSFFKAFPLDPRVDPDTYDVDIGDTELTVIFQKKMKRTVPKSKNVFKVPVR